MCNRILSNFLNLFLVERYALFTQPYRYFLVTRMSFTAYLSKEHGSCSKKRPILRISTEVQRTLSAASLPLVTPSLFRWDMGGIGNEFSGIPELALLAL